MENAASGENETRSFFQATSTVTMPTNAEARDLVERAQGGEATAFDALVELYRKRLLALIRSRLGSALSRQIDAEDILQEALLKAFQSLGRFTWQGDDSFVRWVGTIAERTIRDVAKRPATRRAVALPDDLNDSATTASHASRRHERFDRLEDAFDRLSPEHRQVILLARIAGLPMEEVARRMDRSKNAASHLLLRALRKLREGFGDTESLHLPERRLDPGREGHES